MALNDQAVLLPSTGYIYFAPVGTAAPTSNEPSGTSQWENIGHTSREEGMAITREGGDRSVLGTWQAPSLRERQEPTSLALTFQLHQVTNSVLTYYFGGGDTSQQDVFGVPSNGPSSVERAFYARLIDGTEEVGLYVPKVSLGAEDDVEVDVEGLLAFPVRATVLSMTGSNLMEFMHPRLGAV